MLKEELESSMTAAVRQFEEDYDVEIGGVFLLRNSVDDMTGDFNKDVEDINFDEEDTVYVSNKPCIKVVIQI